MILTLQEAVDMLRLDDAANYPQLDIILPAVDEYIKTATGKDWGADETIDPVAKMTASVLLTRWFEDPATIGTVKDSDYGIVNLVGQLEAKVLSEVETE